ncbi:uncharacterized protein THITE_2121267 [Thermothielavioides terrestris NRRL 8126]|uniref:Uncharacterized protein n=1 Tax=Thermothielavioides terrestris (strain ATCC 38088 / NRRL 8126) TaxID=578455 RepID=G2REQ5_THETT|nr:uncharacterized protein THITE_2121267 [Thermothielavioides terrestris NRRL 8126]AEO70188.1 hypothetical protein THITE_2121267 [Thermothielavioides terrestris NRRL 8126]
MDTERQAEVESPLLEDFLDCDQLVSDSDGGSSSSSASPRRTLKRLHIHVDMTRAPQYLPPSAHHAERPQMDGLPVCTSGPQTVAFSSPDLDPYSAVSGVSSFNYPAAVDPSLLTPVSSAGSPPLQHRQSAKPMRNYHPSQPSAPASQAPTPPNTSKLYFENYAVSSSSQGSSPMTVNPAATEGGPFDMTPYMAHSPPVSHHPSSPKSEIPPPIDPYLGHFAVSGTNDGEVTHQPLPEYHTYGVEVAAPGAYLGQSHVPVGTPHMHHRMPSNGAAPVLSQPHPSHYRPPPSQVGAIEDLRDPSMLLGAYQAHGALSPGRRPQPRKKPSPARKPSRTPKATPHLGSDVNGPFKHEDEDEELTLNDDAPEDDKYLFQLRKQYLSEKGKGMWEEMKAKYSEKHQGNWEKAALQMKVSRAVAKYGVWPEKEIERLKEAFHYFEEKRYHFIIARMKENGGCRAWDWKPAHIECQLVKLGLEEPTVNEKTGSRRRRQKAARRQASPQNGGHAVMGDWGNGLGLQHAGFHSHAHQVAVQAAARQGGPYSNHNNTTTTMMGDSHFGAAPSLTPAQTDELINQVFSKVKEEDSLSPDEGMEGFSYDHDAGSRRPSTSAARELDHQGSERVARGTCQQMLGNAYGAQ